MSYRVEVDFTPAHELILSLDAFVNGPVKLLEQGADWVKAVEASLTPQEAEAVRLPNSVEHPILNLLASHCPSRGDTEAFLQWYAGLGAGELYEWISPYLPPDKSELLRDLEAMRDRHLRALIIWRDRYFRHIEPSILERLAREAAWRKERVKELPPVDAVDEATCGVVVRSGGLDKVLLIPGHHYRPMNRFTKLGPIMVCSYAVEVPAAKPGLPSADLLRLTRALGDESRLRILHYLAGDLPRTFTEVQRATELSKNTVHHHLAMLRSSGLVQVHLNDDCGGERYTARLATVDEISHRVRRFLDNR